MCFNNGINRLSDFGKKRPENPVKVQGYKTAYNP